MKRPALLRIDKELGANRWQALCHDALASGFDGFEIAMTHATEPDAFAQVDARPVVVVTAACVSTEVEVGLAEVSSLLERSALVQAKCLNLTLPGISGCSDENSFGGYQDALNFAHRLLYELRHEAESAGVAIALEAASAGCLLSPVELREIVNQANSWAVGVCLDLDRVARVGNPMDWIRTLGGRIHAVRDFSCDRVGSSKPTPRANSLGREAVAEALDSIGYSRPVIGYLRDSAEETRVRLAGLGCSARRT